MLLLIAVRMPVGLSMLLVGAVGYSSCRAGGVPRLHEDEPLSAVRQLHAVGDPAVHPDGRVGRAVGHGARPVRAAAQPRRPYSRRARHGGDRGLHRRSAPSAARRSPPPPPSAAPRCRNCAATATMAASATGIIAVGGTLGILIPPSVILVVYAITTEQNIAKLFMAALIPGLMAARVLLHRDHASSSAAIPSWRHAGPATPPPSARRCCSPAALAGAGRRVRVVGGIYGGVFTPTEGAAVGAIAMLAVGVAAARLGWPRSRPPWCRRRRPRA